MYYLEGDHVGVTNEGDHVGVTNEGDHVGSPIYVGYCGTACNNNHSKHIYYIY